MCYHLVTKCCESIKTPIEQECFAKKDYFQTNLNLIPTGLCLHHNELCYPCEMNTRLVNIWSDADANVTRECGVHARKNVSLFCFILSVLK